MAALTLPLLETGHFTKNPLEDPLGEEKEALWLCLGQPPDLVDSS